MKKEAGGERALRGGAQGSGPRASAVYARIYALVRRIPRGRVASYGQVARLLGMPGRARQVGYALHALRDETVPWHRVVNAAGRVSARAVPGADALQRRLLEREGVRFDASGRVPLERYGWDAEAGAARSRRRTPR